MAKAATREKEFTEICNQIATGLLSGKKITFKSEDVSISVDNSIILEEEIILIEIDASNVAKYVAGQYTLLNLLKKKPTKTYEKIVQGKTLVFFVVHCYCGYNIDRTIKNLKFINKEAFADEGLKFGSIHIEELENIRSKKELLVLIKTKIS